MSDQQQSGHHRHDGSIKETFVSLAISFVMALVFRSFVVEAFVIPTGSMAPTLLGAHMDFRSDQTGYEWAVNPWYPSARGQDVPAGIQGGTNVANPSVTDPTTTTGYNQEPLRRRGRARGHVTPPEIKRLRAGDRILVQKYLYELFPPSRWDVVVFKNPELATQNFIKRLVGLPGEQIWIVDGDIFARAVSTRDGGDPVPEGDWTIQRKPHSVQKSLWRLVHSSEYSPLTPERDGRRWFQDPWRGPDWLTRDRRTYRNDTSTPSTLSWDDTNWPIWDWVPYNEFPTKVNSRVEQFPVADLRLRAGIEPDGPGLSAAPTIRARSHEFQAFLDDSGAVLRMRPEGATEWQDLATGDFGGFAPGRVTNIELWHADQALTLVVNGSVIAEAEYDWSPIARLGFSTIAEGEAFLDPDVRSPALSSAATYRPAQPALRWEFDGSALTMHRVGVDRDLFYEPAQSSPMRASRPYSVATLEPDHYFVLGDNSPSSKDGRLWDTIDEAIALQIDPTEGVVHRKLLLGKAFFVYFPAPKMLLDRIPIPDFGRMRLIR